MCIGICVIWSNESICFFPYNISNGKREQAYIYLGFDYFPAYMVHNGLYKVHFWCIQLKIKHLQKHNPHKWDCIAQHKYKYKFKNTTSKIYSIGWFGVLNHWSRFTIDSKKHSLSLYCSFNKSMIFQIHFYWHIV